MRKLSLISILATLAFSPAAFAQATATGTTTMSVIIGAEATISITNPALNLLEAAPFTNFTGTTIFNYQVRTSTAGGRGSITLQVTTDFGAGGATNTPSVANPPAAADKLTYTCTGGGVSNPTVCPAQTASMASMPVLTFATDAHSNAAPGDTGSVSWTLVNDPKYKTGTYTSTVTFTISAA